MRTLILFLTGIVALTIVSPSFGDVILYDSSVSGQTPDDQNLYYLALFGPIDATQSWAAGLTMLDTRGDISESAGYYNYDTLLAQPPKVPLTLDQTGDGYTLRFFAQVVSENHSLSSNRAGFSVIALSGDMWGIELGFWDDSIWAQDDTPAAFIRDESTLFDTTSSVVRYDLAIQNTGYTLYADGAPLLSGLLRSYATYVPNDLAHHVYHQANFVFLGDNTSSASAELLLGDVVVLDAAVPEPATLSLLGAAGMLMLRRRSAQVLRRRRHIN